MIMTWYAILSFILTAFILLEGFDIGGGTLLYVVGKTDAERRGVIAAIGPLLSWNEVWLVSFGGTLLIIRWFLSCAVPAPLDALSARHLPRGKRAC